MAETEQEKAARETARNDLKGLFKESLNEWMAEQEKTRTEAAAKAEAEGKGTRSSFGGGLLSRLGLE
jgi:hypothetical protein